MPIATNFNNTIPYLYEQQYKHNPIIYARYIIHGSDWEWLILEYSKHQRLFYGVILPEEQATYFTLEELQAVEREYGVEIELDTTFKPTPLQQLLKQGA